MSNDPSGGGGIARGMVAVVVAAAAGMAIAVGGEPAGEVVAADMAISVVVAAGEVNRSRL